MPEDPIHVVLDNLSTHATPEVQDWLDENQHVTFHFTPFSSSLLNQVSINRPSALRVMCWRRSRCGDRAG